MSTSAGVLGATAPRLVLTADRPEAGGVDDELFWRTVRKFATGVSVVTAGRGATSCGATVSAFTFVSRRPPLISLCLDRSGGILGQLAHHHHFAVNVLGGDQAALARHFADPLRPRGPAQFRDVAWRPGLGRDLPLLDGALCWLGCRFVRRVAAGDHEILLARVTGAEEPAAEPGHGPLLYFAGRLLCGEIPEP
jgi:flavin reductase (DIM6/NTAB) family NADH-FMN oxidoreductase RutF